MAFSKSHKRSRSPKGKRRQSLYKTQRWKDLRAAQLAAYPMCQCPHCKGQKLKAQIVHHAERHGGDKAKFFNPNNLRSMNKQCHDKFKQSQEAGGHGFNQGVDETGQPLSREHEWYG